MKYKQGDILINKDEGDKCKVLAVCGDTYCLSEDNAFDVVSGWSTEVELDDMGYVLDEPLLEGYLNVYENMGSIFHESLKNAKDGVCSGFIKTIKVREVIE